MSLMLKWLIAAGILIVLGIAVCLGAYKFLDVKFDSMNTVELKTESFDVDDKFKNIDVTAVYNDVILLPSEEKECKVVITDYEGTSHEINVDNETLVIKCKAADKKQHTFGIQTTHPTVKIYLPESEYKDFTANLSTGDVTFPNDFSFENVNIAGASCDVSCDASVKGTFVVGVTTGDIDLSNSSPENVNIKVTTGDVKIVNVNCKGGITITATTGDISFDKSDADSIYVKTTTGDIDGTLLTGKKFTAKANIGNIHVPDSTGDKTCDLITNTGDIDIEIGE